MIALVAYGASSALGEGRGAVAPGKIGDEAKTRVAVDDELRSAGLLRPYAARAAIPKSAFGDRDRATVLFERALAACAAELDIVMPEWRSRRIGLAIGTSSGGMRTFEENLGRGPLPFEGTYLGPVVTASRPCAFDPFAFVLGACTSSTLAIGLARAWLVADRCDIALCGGFDGVGTFVASGFEALRATSATPGPRPFRVGRDGLALGEGAAVLALVREEILPPSANKVIARVSGFGAACDAVHLTAPDRAAGGLRRALTAALADAGLTRADRFELVSAHGTATPFNDESEAPVIAKLAGAPVVHAFKATIGHALGAAGALETLAAIEAMRAGIGPASYGRGEIEGGVRLLDRNEALDVPRAIKLASAFGGVTAALVLERDARAQSAKPPREVVISRAVAIVDDLAGKTAPAALAASTGYAEDRIARGDLLVRLTLAAVAELASTLKGAGVLRGAGILVGHGLATIETNATYLARIREAGAARGEPRRFPYTTPNAAAGEASVAFGLTGPSFAVGGGPHGGIEALAVAADLVRTSVVDRVVVVAVDEAAAASGSAGPGTRSGAVALLVSAADAAIAPVARLVDARVSLGVEPLARGTVLTVPLDAHRGLLPLVAGRPEAVEVSLPWGGFAKAAFFWL